MSPSTSATLLSHRLRVGPRSPLLLYALVLPFIATFLIRSVFGDLFVEEPRVGVVDPGSSEVAERYAVLDGLDVSFVDDEETLRRRVAGDELDTGLVLPPDVDRTLRSGERPDIGLYVGAASVDSDQGLALTSLLEVVRLVAGREAPVEVTTEEVESTGVPLALRMVPMLVMFAVALSGLLVPAASLIEERTKGTMSAVLVTPASVTDVLAATAAMGIVLSLATGTVTLALNGGFGGEPLALVVAMSLGALMMVEIGLALGAWARDTNTLFTVWKAGGTLLFFPIVFYLFPELPQWIAKLGITYWFLQPIFAVTAEGAPASDVWPTLAACAGICVLLLPLVWWAGRRLSA